MGPLYIMRHGERLDYAFGDWISQCFDKNGNYCPTNLNMPDSVPKRSQGPSAYIKDSPLTKMGIFQAQLTGEAFVKEHLEVSDVYCSPSLRCIQTCDAFLKGCNKNNEIKIKVEPGLFEWWAFHTNALPIWLTPEEMVEYGYNIDLNYKPYGSYKIPSEEETCDVYYSRSFSLTLDLLRTHPEGNILFVGHATTLEACTRQLLGQKPRNIWNMKNIIKSIPYCAIIDVNKTKSGEWEMKPSLHQLTHTSNLVFDYDRLL